MNNYQPFMYSGRESNPYGHFCPQDFKSCVSTYSTTRALILSKKPPPCGGGFCLRGENETRTRDPNLGKVMLYQLSYFRIWDCKSNNFFTSSKNISKNLTPF